MLWIRDGGSATAGGVKGDVMIALADFAALLGLATVAAAFLRGAMVRLEQDRITMRFQRVQIRRVNDTNYPSRWRAERAI